MMALLHHLQQLQGFILSIAYKLSNSPFTIIELRVNALALNIAFQLFLNKLNRASSCKQD